MRLALSYRTGPAKQALLSSTGQEFFFASFRSDHIKTFVSKSEQKCFNLVQIIALISSLDSNGDILRYREGRSQGLISDLKGSFTDQESSAEGAEIGSLR